MARQATTDGLCQVSRPILQQGTACRPTQTPTHLAANFESKKLVWIHRRSSLSSNCTPPQKHGLALFHTGHLKIMPGRKEFSQRLYPTTQSPVIFCGGKAPQRIVPQSFISPPMKHSKVKALRSCSSTV